MERWDFLSLGGDSPLHDKHMFGSKLHKCIDSYFVDLAPQEETAMIPSELCQERALN